MEHAALRVVFVAVLLAGLTSPAVAKETVELSVDLANARNEAGQLCVALYREGRGYPEDSEEAVARACVPMTALPWRVRLPPGKYAAAVFHDEDENGRLSRRLFGIPREGYGFSNDASRAFGPPPWEDAAFQLSADRRLVLKLTYF